MNAPVVIVGGWLSAATDYQGLAKILAGAPYRRIVYIVDIQRRDWFAVRDPDFRPILDIIAVTIELACEETGAAQVDLIGHSAGGRMARAYLSDADNLGRCYAGHRRVRQLTTIGTAHATDEVFVAQFGAWLTKHTPGAFYPQVHYRSIAGRSIYGKAFGRPEEILAFRSYQLTCGNGNVWGDGIIPTASCYLDGAENLILQGIRHAPYNAPNDWYGARKVVEAWYPAT